MADGVLDQLRVDVEADGGRAAQELEKVAQAVDHLKSSVGRGVTTKIAALTASLTQLASVPSLSHVADGMREVASASQAMAGVKVSDTIAKHIPQIATAVSSMPEGTAQRLNELAAAMQGMSGITMRKETATNIASIAQLFATTPLPDGVSAKLRDIADGVAALAAVTPPTAALGNQLRNIAAGASALSATELPEAKVTALVTALSHLAEIPKNGLSTTVRAMKQLPEAAKALHGLDFDQLAEDCKRLSAALADLPERLANVAAGMRQLAKANAAANKYERMGRVASGGILGNLAGMVKFVAGAMLVRKAVGGIRDAVSAAGDYVEDMNLFTVAMGEFGEQAWQYAQQVNEALGINPQEWAKGQGVFMSMAKGMGIASDNAALMSQQLTQLSYDLSSFYNIDVATAMEKVQAGLAGQLRPLRELGYDLSDARLKQDAYAWGIEKSVDSMTQGEKAMLRYREMIEQVSFVHGDMARTVQSPMNQIRILASAARQAAVAWGGVLLPALSAVMSILIPLARALATVGNLLASLTGGKAMMDSFMDSLGSGGQMSSAVGGMEDLEDATDAAGGSAGSAKKKYDELKRTILGFDELNVLKDASESGSGSGGGGGAGGGGGGGLEGFELPTYDFLGDGSPYKALEERITATMNRILEKWQPFTEQLSISWERVKKSFEGTDILGSFEDNLVQKSAFFATWATETLKIFTNLWVDLGAPHLIELTIDLDTAAWHVATAAVESLGEALVGLTEGLSPVTQWIGGQLANALTWVTGEFEEWATWLEEMTPTFHDLGEQIGLLASNIGSILQPVIDPLISAFGTILSWIGDFMRFDLKARISGVVETLRGINEWFDKHGPGIREKVEWAVDKVGDAKDRVVEFAKTLNTKLNKAKELISDVGGLFMALAKDIRAAMEGDFSFSNVKQYMADLQEAADKAGESVEGVSKHVPKATTATEKAAKAGVGSVTSSVTKAVSKAVPKLQGAVEGAGTEAIDGATPTVEREAGKLGGTFDRSAAAGVTNATLSAKVTKTLGTDVLTSLSNSVKNSTIPATSGRALATAFSGGITGAASYAKAAGATLANSGAAGLGDKDAQKTGKSHGGSMGTLYSDALGAKESYAGTQAKKVGTNAVYWLDYRGTAKTYGEGMGTKYGTGIGSKESFAGGKAKAVAKNSLYWLEYQDQAYTRGKWFGEGFGNGIVDDSAWQNAINKAKKLAKKALQTLYDTTREGSPSRITMQYGQWFTEGFGIGIDAQGAMVAQSAREMAQGAIDAVGRVTDAGGLDLGTSIDSVATMAHTVTGRVELDYDRIAEAVAYGTLTGIVQAGGQQSGQQPREITFAIDGQTLARVVVDGIGAGAADGTLDLAPLMEVM